MNQTPERHDSAATAERPTLSIEEVIEKYPNFKAVKEYAEDAFTDGNALSDMQRLLLTNWKQGVAAFGTHCLNEHGELRYVVFAKERNEKAGNVAAGVAIAAVGIQPWPGGINR